MMLMRGRGSRGWQTQMGLLPRSWQQQSIRAQQASVSSSLESAVEECGLEVRALASLVPAPAFLFQAKPGTPLLAFPRQCGPT